MRLHKGFIYLPIAWLTSASFILALISGIILSFHYFYNQPLISVLKIESFVPFGKYWRELHYLSAQVSLIGLFFHLIDSVYKNFYFLKGKKAWFFLVSSLFALIFITFTGYLLRGDEMGELAGSIAENLLLSIPYLGDLLNKIFFAPSQIGLWRVYNWHIFLSYFLALGLFLWHLKLTAFLRWKNFSYFIILCLLPLFWDFPLKSYQGLVARGPWFFVGAQELLKFFPPPLVFFWLLLPFFFLILYSYFPEREKFIHLLFLAYLLSYLSFSILFFI